MSAEDNDKTADVSAESTDSATQENLTADQDSAVETSKAEESSDPKLSKNELKKASRSGNPAKKAAAKKQRKAEKAKKAGKKKHRNRNWVPYVFIPVGILGLLWLIVFYIAGYDIPFMAALGNWNFAVGLGLIGLSFIIATLWE